MVSFMDSNNDYKEKNNLTREFPQGILWIYGAIS